MTHDIWIYENLIFKRIFLLYIIPIKWIFNIKHRILLILNTNHFTQKFSREMRFCHPPKVTFLLDLFFSSYNKIFILNFSIFFTFHIFLYNFLPIRMWIHMSLMSFLSFFFVCFHIIESGTGSGCRVNFIII